MQEYGIWDDLNGGFVDAGFYSEETAQAARDELFATEHDAYEDKDLKVLPICPDHDEQPRDTCEECMTEEDE